MNTAEEMLADIEHLNKANLNLLGMSLKEKLEEIKSLDSEVLTLVKDEDLDDEIGQADLYKERIYSTLISIEKATEPASLLPTVSATPPTVGVVPTPGTAHSNKVRLPKLTIKPFNGKLTA